MSNPEFDKLMQELMAVEPLPESAYPLCFHNPDGDMLEVVLSPESYWARGPGADGLMEHWSHGDNRLVGFTIYGLSKRKPPGG